MARMLQTGNQPSMHACMHAVPVTLPVCRWQGPPAHTMRASKHAATHSSFTPHLSLMHPFMACQWCMLQLPGMPLWLSACGHVGALRPTALHCTGSWRAGHCDSDLHRVHHAPRPHHRQHAAPCGAGPAARPDVPLLGAHLRRLQPARHSARQGAKVPHGRQPRLQPGRAAGGACCAHRARMLRLYACARWLQQRLVP